MSNKKFYLINVIPSDERRFCFFFILDTTIDGLYSYKISHYYPTNIKKKISIKLIQLLPFNDWFQCWSTSEYSMSLDLIFDKFCSYFMVRKSGTTYTIRECYL